MEYRLLSVCAADDYTLLVVFQNGVEKKYDMKPLIQKIPDFQLLLQISGLFKQVKVDVGGAGISWNDDIDLSAEDLWEDGVETGRRMPVSLMQNIGSQISLLRKKTGKSQTEIAESIGMHQAELSKIERGIGNPSISTLEKIASSLGSELYIEFVKASDKSE